MFSRKYRAALLDYLLDSGESGRQRAYELGRRAMECNVGLLHVLRLHHQTVSAVLEATHRGEDGLRRLKAAEEFLMELLSSFEMANRGYVDLIDDGDSKRRRQRTQ